MKRCHLMCIEITAKVLRIKNIMRQILIILIALNLFSCGNTNPVTTEQEQTRPYRIVAFDLASFNYAYMGQQVTIDVGALIEPGIYVEPIYAYRLTLNYDPAYLQFVSAEKGFCLTDSAGSTTYSAALKDGIEGGLLIEEVSDSGDGHKGACQLSLVTFTVLKYGSTSISYSDVSLTGPDGNEVLNTNESQVINLYGA